MLKNESGDIKLMIGIGIKALEINCSVLTLQFCGRFNKTVTLVVYKLGCWFHMQTQKETNPRDNSKTSSIIKLINNVSWTLFLYERAITRA